MAQSYTTSSGDHYRSLQFDSCDLRKHIFAEVIILAENVAMSILSKYFLWQDDLSWLYDSFLATIWSAYGLNLLLKIVIYKFFNAYIVEEVIEKKLDAEIWIRTSLVDLALNIIIVLMNGLLLLCIFYGKWAMYATEEIVSSNIGILLALAPIFAEDKCFCLV